MTMRSVMLQLRDDQIERLDGDAARTGRSRSRLVRDAVDALLDGTGADPDLAEQYRRAYAEGLGVDVWGSLEAWHEAAARSRQSVTRDPW